MIGIQSTSSRTPLSPLTPGPNGYDDVIRKECTSDASSENSILHHSKDQQLICSTGSNDDDEIPLNDSTKRTAVTTILNQRMRYSLLGCMVLIVSFAMVATAKYYSSSTQNDLSLSSRDMMESLVAEDETATEYYDNDNYDEEAAAKDFVYTRSLITKHYTKYLYELEKKKKNSNNKNLQEDSVSSTRVSETSFTKNNKCNQPVIKTPLAGKKGIGLGRSPLGQIGQLYEHTALLKKLNIAWNYNWNIKPAFNQPHSMEFLPMLWTSLERSEFMMLKINQFIMPLVVSGNVHRILGFNEPDAATQAGMTVANAVTKWKSLVTLDIPLISPACVSPLGTWMTQFMQQATNLCLRVDYIGVHWYGSPNATAFALYMEKVYNTYKIPLMITEFAPADWSAKSVESNKYSQPTVLKFMKQAVPWLERTNYIAGYAWFSFPPKNPNGWSSSLFDSDGNLNALGKFYKSVTNSKKSGNQKIFFSTKKKNLL